MTWTPRSSRLLSTLTWYVPSQLLPWNKIKRTCWLIRDVHLILRWCNFDFYRFRPGLMTCGTLTPSSPTNRCQIPSAVLRTPLWSHLASQGQPRPSWDSHTLPPWIPTCSSTQQRHLIDFLPVAHYHGNAVPWSLTCSASLWERKPVSFSPPPGGVICTWHTAARRAFVKKARVLHVLKKTCIVCIQLHDFSSAFTPSCIRQTEGER